MVALSENFSSDSLHFSIQYPKTWEVLSNPKDPRSVALVQKATNDSANYLENLVIWVEEMPMAISDSVYYQASVTQLKISNPALNITKTGKTNLGGRDFSSFTFDMTGKNGVEYTIAGYCLVQDKLGYNFSCTALKRNMQSSLPLFKKIISTFKTR